MRSCPRRDGKSYEIRRRPSAFLVYSFVAGVGVTLVPSAVHAQPLEYVITFENAVVRGADIVDTPETAHRELPGLDKERPITEAGTEKSAGPQGRGSRRRSTQGVHTSYVTMFYDPKRNRAVVVGGTASADSQRPGVSYYDFNANPMLVTRIDAPMSDRPPGGVGPAARQGRHRRVIRRNRRRDHQRPERFPPRSQFARSDRGSIGRVAVQ